MSDQAGLNLRWSINLLAGLIESGLDRLVISPGSRSTPLVIAANSFPQLAVRVQVDERSAAFYALGQARALDKPVALLCTSGSAPANWLPAVVEASQAGVPLILLTADRPWELQQCAANQTLDQSRLFSGYVRSYFGLAPAEPGDSAVQRLRALARQAIHESSWPDPGPVHINVPLREPLLPLPAKSKAPELTRSQPRRPGLSANREQLNELAKYLTSGRGIIVCGSAEQDAGFARGVTMLASGLGCPVLADPLSGLRFGDHDLSSIVSRYDIFLRDREFARGHQPDWVLRFGNPPVSRVLQDYLAASGTSRHILVENRGRWPDPLNRATDLVRADAALFCRQLVESIQGTASPPWGDGFRRKESQIRAACESAGQEELPPEARVIEQLLAALPDSSLLFTGNSLPIRFLDSYSGTGKKTLQILANRGVSGIDGNISTLLGLADAYLGKGKVVGLLGDLAFYHDMNGLAAAAGLDATIVLLNNGGGGIFQHLPQSRLPGFEKFWRTPLNIDYSHAARMYGLEYQVVTDLDDLARAMENALSGSGVNLIEVMVDARNSTDLHQAFISRVN